MSAVTCLFKVSGGFGGGGGGGGVVVFPRKISYCVVSISGRGSHIFPQRKHLSASLMIISYWAPTPNTYTQPPWCSVPVFRPDVVDLKEIAGLT